MMDAIDITVEDIGLLVGWVPLPDCDMMDDFGLDCERLLVISTRHIPLQRQYLATHLCLVVCWVDSNLIAWKARNQCEEERRPVLGLYRCITDRL